ncbi:hypothetical protein FRC01_003765 [Tulasnella sp. 417]|nr:hypothetical protein FRC01_003765 [Tulasnella sp. 417]
MTAYHSSTFNQAISHPDQPSDDVNYIRIASSENADLASASGNTHIVAATTFPHDSGVGRSTAEDGIYLWRDSRGGPRQLPEELFIEIIRQAASNPRIDPNSELLSDPTFFHALNDYRRVSKGWKTIIDGASTLWAFLSADTPSSRVVQNAIAKSKNSPLVISYGSGVMELQRFIELVAPQMGRCKALWMDVKKSDASAVQSLFDKPCPSLEELHIHGKSLFGPTVHIDSTDANMESLRFALWALRHNPRGIKILSLRSAGGWRTGLSLTELRELRLAGSRIHVDDLIEFLRELPLLRMLVIERSTSRTGQRIVDESIVEVPLLTRLELQRVDSSLAHAILSRIHPPSLKQLIMSITFSSSVFHLGDVGTGYQTFIRSLIEAQGTSPIPIVVGAIIQRFAIADKQTYREFELSGAGGPSFILRFGAKDHPDDSIHMTREILKPLMDIKGIVKIQVGERAFNVQYLYQRLSYAIAGADRSRRWLLPQLGILEVHGHEGQDKDLVHMLERRHDRTGIVIGDTVAPLPLYLVKLVRQSLQRIQPQIAENIRSIIGEEHFCVEIKESR